MSTKDILDRLASSPSSPKARPVAEAKPGEVRPSDVRVGNNVLRRRAPTTPEPPPPPPPRTVIRRPGPAREEASPLARTTATPPPHTVVPATDRRAPVRSEPVVARAERPAPVVTPPPAEVAAPVVELAVVDVVEPVTEVVVDHPPLDLPAPEPESEPAVQAAPVVEAEPAPPAQEAAPADPSLAVEAAAPEAPAAPALPAPEPTMERAVIIERPGGPVRPLGPSGPTRQVHSRLPDVPILPGLGRAVVSLPVGYDPTDPTGARRRAREQASQTTRWGAQPPAAPPPGRRPDAPVETDASRDKKKGRRGERAELSMANINAARVRRKGGKGKDIGKGVAPAKVKRKVRIDGEMTVSNLAHEMGVKAAELVKLLMQMGQPATMNQFIDFDTAAILAQELGHEVTNVSFQESEHLIQAGEDEESDLPHRPPVITVMGHVDHGKTTLLDALRKTKVAAGEAGGITQHIGAYQVRRGDRDITFIDTPGHAAFSAMRARGAKATDVVVLVVAADDGVMPQTIEAIHHAKAADVPILVAVNKIDKPGVNLDSIRRELMQHGLVPEEYGGDTIFVNVSALKGTGIEDLLDNLLVLSEVLDLRANPDRHAEGVVLEARVETGRGAVATLLVQNGTLKQGDILVIGNTWGRIRAMSDDTGRKVKDAGPSTPVEIFGLQETPQVGAEFIVVSSEKDARTLAEHRADTARVGALSQRKAVTVDDLYKLAGLAAPIQHVVLKTDVGGSLEALRGALEAIQVTGTLLKILHSGIGPVTESDVTLAAANSAVVIAFNVKADAKSRQAADQFGVDIQRYDIIYNVIDDVKARMLGMLAPVYEERKAGEAEVRALFTSPKAGTIAGCMVLDGKILRGSHAKVVRDGKLVHEGKVTSLRRFKEDVKDVEKGFECGIGIEDFPTIAVGDIIQVFQKVEVPRTAA